MIIYPQLGVGGCEPIPRNERPLSSRIDEAKFAADKIKIGGRMLGSILFSKILKLHLNHPEFDKFIIYFKIHKVYLKMLAFKQ